MPEPIDFPDFATAYGRYWPPVVAKCQRLLGRTATAEEIAQETFVRLWQSGPRLSERCPPATLLAWLYVTSTRLGIDALRRNRWLVATEADPYTPCAVPPHSCVEARSLIATLSNQVSALELEVALLVRVDGLRHSEVAECLHISERSVRRRLREFDQHCARLREENS